MDDGERKQLLQQLLTYVKEIDKEAAASGVTAAEVYRQNKNAGMFSNSNSGGDKPPLKKQKV